MIRATLEGEQEIRDYLARWRRTWRPPGSCSSTVARS